MKTKKKRYLRDTLDVREVNKKEIDAAITDAISKAWDIARTSAPEARPRKELGPPSQPKPGSYIWVLFDLSNGHEFRRYLWWFWTRKEAREFLRQQRREAGRWRRAVGVMFERACACARATSGRSPPSA